MIHIAIVGDIHHYFTQFDVDYFNQSAYDLLLVTGDLPFHGRKADRRLVSLLAALEKPALLIPGNHDCTTTTQFLAEVAGQSWLSNLSLGRQQELASELERDLKPVVMCGYSVHEFQSRGVDLAVIAARPVSFGGPKLSYQSFLKSTYGVDSLAASSERLIDLINRTPIEKVLFLSHNGPSGLGSRAEDIWGCDFKPQAGDYGDPDLEIAIDYAKRIGKEVLAVAAGHMHHILQNGGNRRWLLRRDDTTYINAARVPRIIELEAEKHHQHVALSIDGHNVSVEERLIRNH